MNEGSSMVSASAINMVTDILVVMSPMPIVWNLDLPKRTRIAVIFLFGLGFLGCFIGVVRIYFTVIVTMTKHKYDFTWEGYGMWITGLVELDLAIVSKEASFTIRYTNRYQICASVPSLKPLFVRPLSALSSKNRSGQEDDSTPSTVLATVGRSPFNERQHSIHYNRSFHVDDFDAPKEPDFTEMATEKHDWDDVFSFSFPLPIEVLPNNRVDPLRTSKPTRTQSLYSKNGDKWYEHREVPGSVLPEEDPTPLH
jgi:hypothetical protein